MGKSKRSIKSILIDRSFQGQMFALVIGFGLTVLILSIFSIQMTWLQMENAIARTTTISLDGRHDVLETVINAKSQMIVFNVSVFILIGLVFALFTMKLTHNAAGAVYRFKIEFEKMAENKKIHKVTMRQNDFFRETEESFNKLVDKIGES